MHTPCFQDDRNLLATTLNKVLFGDATIVSKLASRHSTSGLSAVSIAAMRSE
jgi:hypothetical protein